MMTIGEMYKRSGGVYLYKKDEQKDSVLYTRQCADCKFFKEANSIYKTAEGVTVTRGECSKYRGEAPWKSSFIACKYFKE